MNGDKLIRMANQIADFFKSYPEEQALAGIRDHIVAYWTPGMRSQILTALDGAAVNPLVGKALRTAQTGTSPIEKEIAGPDQLGAMESDAG
ncbi:MAG: formate dehydrogenase subunit delta [Microvirga sp.]